MATVTKPIALDESFNTTEVTPRNIADVLAEELGRLGSKTASDVTYDNTASGLVAENVQDALDEINGKVVQSDWEQADPTADDYIKNKPTTDLQTAVDSFSTLTGGLLSEAKLTLSPVQDLHGYDSPWVGGAGKNKLPLVLADIKSANTSGTWSGNAYTANGTTFTVNTDDEDNVISVDVANVPSATTAFIVYTSSINPFDTNLSYILNGCPSGGGASTRYKLDFIYEKNGSLYTLLTDTGSSAQEAFSQLVGATSVMVRIVIYTNASLPKTFYPMLRLSTESDPTFEPYSNICPISGHTEVDILNVGKNRWDEQWRNGYYQQSAGSTYGDFVSFASAVANANPIPVQPSTDYYLYLGSSGGGAIFFYDSNHDAISHSLFNASAVITTPANCAYVNFNLNANPYGSTYKNDIAFNYPSTATDYVPYNGYQITVNLGGTYYSGTLDVVTGVFTPDTAEVDLGSLTWTYQSNYPRFRADAPSDIKFPSSSSITADVICDIYESVSMDVTQTKDSSIGIGLTAYPYIYAHDTRYTDANVYKTAMSGVMLVYKLATPTPIQLSPTMVKALVGENHLSAPLEGQTIDEVKYKQMFTFDDVIAYIQSLS